MARYAIKHKPTGKFFYEDEGGAFLVNEDDSFITFGRKSDADKNLQYMIKYSDKGLIYVEFSGDNGYEDMEFPVKDFEVATL